MAVKTPPQVALSDHGLEELEELGDDAIISQQTAAHVPRPRANVSEEPRSVVISEHAQRRDTEPPRDGQGRSRGEKTVVIRDRRALEELRAEFARRDDRKVKHRQILLWGGLGLIAFVLGGVVAFVATSPEPSAEERASATHVQNPPGPAPARTTNRVESPAPNAQPAPHAVRLEQLPVEHTATH